MATALLPFKRRNIEHIEQTRFINGNFFELKHIKDNSAPCAFCHFLECGSKFKCAFPEDKYKKECVQESGTNKGWNTTEYIECIEGHDVIAKMRIDAGMKVFSNENLKKTIYNESDN